MYNTCIRELPDSIGGLKNLQRLVAGNCSLSSLPDSFRELEVSRGRNPSLSRASNSLIPLVVALAAR